MTLRDYQADISDKAAQCLQQHGIAYLAMQVRTGKTITAFETIRKMGFLTVLFVTKKKAIASIVSDYQHFKNLFACTVINFESVTKVHGTFDIVVIDEAHSLGAYPKPAKRVKDLLKYTVNKPVIYLSGTPTPESFSQIYHQFYVSSFSPFKEYHNFYKWAKDYVNVKKKYLYNRELNSYSDAKQDLIEAATKHLFFSQTQAESGFTETIQEKVLYCKMGDRQAEVIKTLLKDRIVEGRNGAVILGDTAVKIQNKIHQLCSGTVIDENGFGHILSKNKAEYIKEYFAGKKIAVFYKFQAELDLLRQVFPLSTTVPETFQDTDCHVFLGQFQSAREGIRLDKADAIVFFNIDFSFLSYEQARNRIVSKERTKQAILYWIFSVGGIEERIFRVVCKKKDYTNRHFKRDYDVRISVPV